MNAFAGQAIKHLREDFTRLEFDGFCRAVGGNQHLPQRLAFPGYRLECAGHQTAHGIRVAIVKAIISDLEQPALRAQQHAVLRQLERAAPRDFFQHVDRITFAVEMPRYVQRNQVDIPHIRVALAKGPHFGQQVRARSIHRIHP